VPWLPTAFTVVGGEGGTDAIGMDGWVTEVGIVCKEADNPVTSYDVAGMNDA